jgi:hypothetical protein
VLKGKGDEGYSGWQPGKEPTENRSRKTESEASGSSRRFAQRE